MEQLQAQNTASAFAVREVCVALDVSSSGFYAHRHKDEQPRRREDQLLAGALQDAFNESRGTYGSPRLVRALRDRPETAGSLSPSKSSKARSRPMSMSSEKR